jgi:hypothetical protein
MGMPVSVIVLLYGFAVMINAACSDSGVWMESEGLGLGSRNKLKRSRCDEKVTKEIRDYLGVPVSLANVNVKT